MDEIELRAKMVFDAGEWLRLTPEPHFHLPRALHSQWKEPPPEKLPSFPRADHPPAAASPKSRAQVALAPDTTAVTLTQERQRRGMWRP